MARLTIARKAILLTFIALLAMASVPLAGTHLFVQRHVEREEKRSILLSAERVRGAISLKERALESCAEALENAISSALPQNGPLAFNDLQVIAAEADIFAIVTEQLELRQSGRLDVPSKSLLPLTVREKSLVRSKALVSAHAANSVVGILLVDAQPFLVASRQLARPTSSPEKPRERLVIARTIDQRWLTRLGRVTGAHVALDATTASAPVTTKPLTQSHESPIQVSFAESEALAKSAVLDLNGQPSLVLHVREPRSVGPLGKQIFWVLALTLIGGGTTILAAVFFIVNRRLIAPIGALKNAVRRLEQGQHSSVILERDDELGELASGINRMARTIRERETVLRQAHAELKLILDSTADTLCGCNLTGGFRGSPSAMGPLWFGNPAPEQDVASWLFGDHATLVAIFRLGLAQVADEKLPLSVAIDQLPQRFQRHGACFEIVYRPIHEGEDLIGLLLVIKDVTARVKTESAEREARELQIVVGNLVRDRASFDHFVAECESLLQQMHLETNLAQRLVHLHTLKGACSIFGLLTFSDACLALERQIAVNAEAMNEEALRTLRRTFHSTLSRVRRFAPKIDETRLSISLSDYSNFVELLEKRLGHERLLAEAMRLPLESGERLVAKLVQQAYSLAHELGKEVEVEVDDGSTRLVAESTQLLWSSLAHGIRNAVEHGIETAVERVSKGKPAQGSIRIVLREKGHHLAVSLIDDGRGIDWQTLQKKAYANRLPSKREDLVELLFTDGLSTKTETSSISGRGIGLSAIRATCHALGGTCIVYEGPGGIGTELYCTISLAVATMTPSSVHLPTSHTRLSVKPDSVLPEEQPVGPLSGSRNLR